MPDIDTVRGWQGAILVGSDGDKRSGDPQGTPGRTRAGAPAAACLASRAPSV
jgi:hypothetical protein